MSLGHNKASIQRSHLHTVHKGHSPASRTLLDRRHHGKFLWVNAIAVRHNSSQVSQHTTRQLLFVTFVETFEFTNFKMNKVPILSDPTRRWHCCSFSDGSFWATSVFGPHFHSCHLSANPRACRCNFKLDCLSLCIFCSDNFNFRPRSRPGPRWYQCWILLFHPLLWNHLLSSCLLPPPLI